MRWRALVVGGYLFSPTLALSCNRHDWHGGTRTTEAGLWHGGADGTDRRLSARTLLLDLGLSDDVPVYGISVDRLVSVKEGWGGMRAAVSGVQHAFWAFCRGSACGESGFCGFDGVFSGV
jgi:hypothetical protein